MARIVRVARAAPVPIILAVVVLALIQWPTAGPVGPVAPGATLVPESLGHCSGKTIVANYSGRLVVQGGRAPIPSVANVSVDVSYSYLLNYTPKGGNSTLSCLSGTLTARTASTGAFDVSVTLPSDSCPAGSCSAYLGPWGPLLVTLPAAAPPGYFFTSNVSGGSIALAYVAALSAVDLAPWGRTTISVAAPTVIRAHALDGDAQPTPATVGYDWHVEGIDWSILNGTGTPDLTVEALTAGDSAVITVWVNGSYHGANLSLGPTSVYIAALATLVDTGAFAPALADVGTSVAFSMNGTGASGYNYSARFDPGLGQASVSIACATRLIGGGAVGATCRTHLAYAQAGTAQPSVELTNGFSSARWFYPELTVSPALGIAISPDPLVTYAGNPTALVVSVRAGTGSAPFSGACLWAGTGSSVCDLAGAGSWSFPVSYPQPGTYTARASVGDSAGKNQSAETLVEVCSRPTLDPLRTASNGAEVGVPLTVSGVAHGGAGPLAYWWNDSLPNGTLSSGMASTAGELTLGYVPSTPGEHLITLTVRDQLGSVVAAATRLEVLPGPATSIVDSEAANGTPTAGTPFSVSWTALDPFHRRLSEYSEALAIARTGRSGEGGTVWVNASGHSFPLDVAGASAPLAASLWVRGYLNFTIATTSAGELALTVSSPVPLDSAATSGLHWWVAADERDARLSHPVILSPSPRWNHTSWQITDPFGNPIPSGYVEVQTVFGAVVSAVDSPILFNGSAAIVWVNYSAPNDGAGSVYVFSEYGVALLPTVSVPAAPISTGSVLVVVSVAAAAVATLFWVRRRRLRRRAQELTSTERASEELQRLAEGRAHLLSRASRTDPRSPEELAAGVPGAPPTSSELFEWVHGLVADGSLSPVVTPYAAPRFLRSDPEEDPGAPKVELDPDLLERALERAREPPAEGEGASDGLGRS